MSGLCYIDQHLTEAYSKKSIQKVRLELISKTLNPPLKNPSKEICYSIDSLRDRFEEILISENQSINNIKSVTLEFKIKPKGYFQYCFAELATIDNKKLKSVVSYSGKVGEILQHFK